MESFNVVAGLASIVALLLAVAVLVFPRLKAFFSGMGPAEGQARTVAAIVYRDTEVLMVKRRGIGEPLTWYFPSGSLQGADTAEIRGVEEVLEETGIKCRYEKPLGQRVHPDTKVYMYYVACSYISGNPSNRDADENIDVAWVSASEVKARISTDLAPFVEKFLREIADGKYR